MKEKDIEKKDWIQSWDLYRRHQRAWREHPCCAIYILLFQPLSHLGNSSQGLLCCATLLPMARWTKKGKVENKKRKDIPFFYSSPNTQIFSCYWMSQFIKWKNRLLFLFLGLTFSREPNLCNKMKSAAASFILQSFKWVISSLSLFLEKARKGIYVDVMNADQYPQIAESSIFLFTNPI